MSRVVPLIAVGALIQQCSPEAYAQIFPRFDPGILLVVLNEDSTVPATSGRMPAELFAAIGVVDVKELAGVYSLKLQPGARMGRAFAVAQAFDFGARSRYSLRVVEPNYALPIDFDRPPPENGAVRVFSVSARADVTAGEGATIGGIVIPGSFAQRVVFRVRGPSLRALGVVRALADPVLKLYEGTQILLQNDNWGTLREFEKTLARSACPPPEHTLDSMLVTYLDPGISYTAVITGANGETGVALLEIYIVDEFYNR